VTAHLKCQHKVSTTDLGNHMVRLCPEYRSLLMHRITTCVQPDRERSECHIWTCHKATRYHSCTPGLATSNGKVELAVGRPPDPTWKCQPSRTHANWTDQLHHDNNNVPIATLWRQAIGRSHSRVTLRSTSTMH